VLKAEGGADLILDMVGGSYLPRNVKALKDDGRLVQIAFLEGPKVELNFAEVMVRRLTITGSTLRPQSDLAKARIAASLRAHVWPLLDAGRIAPVMDSEFPLEDAAGAHARLESSGTSGRSCSASDAEQAAPRGGSLPPRVEDDPWPARLPHRRPRSRRAGRRRAGDRDRQRLGIRGIRRVPDRRRTYPVYIFSTDVPGDDASPPTISCVGECLSTSPPVAGLR
jgi:hypothetical protein